MDLNQTVPRAKAKSQQLLLTNDKYINYDHIYVWH